MPGWAWAIIVVGAVVVVAIVVWQALKQRRTRTLQGRFGPEYDRTLDSADNRRDAEADLAARADRRDSAGHPPAVGGCARALRRRWQHVQAAVRRRSRRRGAGGRRPDPVRHGDRGYPVDDFEQRAADISVDHPRVVENYREGHRLARSNALGDGTTEDLRQAMRHYRALFDELVEETADEPLRRDRAPADAEDAAVCAGNPVAVFSTWDPRDLGLWDPKNGTIGLARRLQAHLGSEIDDPSTRETRMTPDARIQAEADQLEARWRDDPRWGGIERTYTATDVVRLRGSVVPSRRSPGSARSGSGSSSSATSRCARSARSPAARRCRW